MNAPNRRDNAAREAAVGDDALRAAEALLALGLHNDAVSRAYYAAFHYARALLLLEGLEPKSHRGVFALLENHFEKTRRLSSEALSRFARLQTFRGLADYDAQGRLPADRANEEVASARIFVEEAKRLLPDSAVS
jgi:uncharacterized protein (UPF0332 family)